MDLFEFVPDVYILEVYRNNTQNSSFFAYKYYIDMTHIQAEFREANYFLVKIFCSLNRVSDSVNDADSNDTKILT